MTEDVHFIEDLEERENAQSVGVTTMALGEEVGDVSLPVCEENANATATQ